jgi:hypothetical protein
VSLPLARPRIASALVSLAVVAILLLALAAPRAEAAPTPCGASFSVLHNDRIGPLRLPAGEYDIALLDPQAITCAKASQLFAKFLQDYDGVLPDGWRLDARRARFTKGAGFGFQVSPRSNDTGHGGQHPVSSASKCPTFRVLHNDQIAGSTFRKGTYQMTAHGGLSCSKASSLFARFLQGAQTALPGSWRLDAKQGMFTRGTSGKGFQVNYWQ